MHKLKFPIMHKIMVLCSILCSTTALAIDADFSKSFVVPEKSKINKITLLKQMGVSSSLWMILLIQNGGIDAAGESYSVDFILQEDLSLTMLIAISEHFSVSLYWLSWTAVWQ